jgi:Tfp pilus assembly protein PilX
MLTRIRTRLAAQSGFAMPTVLILLLAGSLFAAASWGAARGDIGQTGADRNAKQATAAAESAIEYYRYQLNLDNSYWTKCDGVTAPAPVNQPNATTPIWRNVPGSTARYRIELVPQNGYATCQAGNPLSMVDGSNGTLQVRGIGQSGNQTRTTVATMRHKGFLDFLWFTDFETTDPTVYSATDATAAALKCDVWRRAGRNGACDKIVFGTDDVMGGPFHTNDDILTCGTPDFGRDPATIGGKSDPIEISGGGTNPNVLPVEGYADGSCGGGGGTNPNFLGTKQVRSPTISMPATNSQLAQVADANWTFTGKTSITIDGDTMTVKNANTGSTIRSGWPPNGVVYVNNGTCTKPYNYNQQYDAEPGCAETYVHGGASPYRKSFTIGSANDIVVDGSLVRDTSANAVGGLIADGFVRIFHPVTWAAGKCGANQTTPATTGYIPGGGPGGTTGAPGRDLGDVQIDAAILSVKHQYGVDNPRCGAHEGTLTVRGAIAQKFRGIVGVVGGAGYTKNYRYDDRLKSISPPYFIDPVVSEWRVIRYNEQVTTSGR